MKGNLLNNPKKFIAMYIAWWVFWALVQGLLLHRMGISWDRAVKDAFVSSVLLGLCCFLALLIYTYYQPGKKNHIYRLFFTLGFSILFCVLFQWSVHWVFRNDAAYLSLIALSMPLRVVLSFLMITFVTVLTWLWRSLEERKAFEKRRSEAEQLVKDAELASLRQQLQPHFLFNSLNSISALAGSRPAEARKMIQQLSDFLRGTLKKDEQKTVSLREELDHLGLYLEIEKVRFGHRLNVEIEAQEESQRAILPPLLLQPIVENAIKFGLYDTIGQTVISIHTSLENSWLNIEIKNPFDPQTQNTNQGTGFGLNSIQRRLLLLYNRNDLLSTEKNGNLFITKLKIPQS